MTTSDFVQRFKGLRPLRDPAVFARVDVLIEYLRLERPIPVVADGFQMSIRSSDRSG